MKPICFKCHRFYRPEKNGYFFLEGMPKDSSAYPGTTEPEMWEPYKLWCGDLWKCFGCGHLLISGVGQEQVSEHYMPDFKEKVKFFGADQFQVNDC